MVESLEPLWIFFKSHQTSLFDEQVPIRGYVDSRGHSHAPTMGLRHKRPVEPPALLPSIGKMPPSDDRTRVRPEKTLADFPEDEILKRAEAILEARLSARREGPDAMDSPEAAGRYLKIKLAERPYEVFAALWLDNQHRVLGFQELFRGSATGASVPVREVLRDAIARNAAAVIFAHNHPSGVTEPSRADISLTQNLKTALSNMDVRILDHVIVGEGQPVSLAARGLL